MMLLINIMKHYINKKKKTYVTQYMDQTGMITPLILVFSTVLIIMAVSVMNLSLTEHRDTIQKVKKNQSLQISEAGINYYKWHLAHDDSDFTDGNSWCCEKDENPVKTTEYCLAAYGACGPYDHQYKDYDDNVIGWFTLKIIPPEIGSTVVTIESTGSVYGADNVEKTITALIGKRSLAEYSFLTNSPIWIGDDESTSGPFHSNDGVRFDGVCNAEVTSAVLEYNCSGTGHDCSGTKDGIWGAGGPDTYWRYPVPIIDFDLFSVNMANIKDKAAQDDGTCNGYSGAGRGICFDDSGAEGYLVKFLADATVDIYRVDSLESKIWYYNLDQGGWKKEAEEIQYKTLLGSFDMPDNGYIFIEDNVWVEGTINGKVTLACAKFPENPNNYTKMRINNNINYVLRDGNHNLGLMSQGDILVPRHAPTDLVIDAMLLSQKGHVYYRYYNSHSIKNSIEVYGGIITNLFWTWTWVSWDGSSYVTIDGYDDTNTIYNNNLTFSPPPSFPTSENFEVLSWKE